MTQLPPEQFAQSNDIKLCYQEFGPQDGEPLVFIMGLGAQMVFWPVPLLQDLANRGFRVIRFDNRDIGKSERFRWSIKSNALTAMARYTARLSVPAEYTLHDMVKDTVGLLDFLNIDKATLIGASMGGMIAQLTAATYPERVKSLVSIMSGTNNPWALPPKPSAMKALIGPKKPAQNVDEYITLGNNTLKYIGGSLPQGELLNEILRASWERGIYLRGIKQQFMAIMATGDFAKRLKAVRCPTTVIHGASDPLLRPSNGKASAKAIKGAKLHLIKGMGHDLPPAVLPEIADLIEQTAKIAS